MPYYHTNGKRIFQRHEINNRRQAATVKYYVSLALERGIVWDDRAGALVCRPDHIDPSKWTLWQLGGATLMEAAC
eukprot:10556274-Alexandrium_andersonii.AAC.1